MAMDLTGINNKNEYYSNYYFASVFADNAQDTVSAWTKDAREKGDSAPWDRFRETARQFYCVWDRYTRIKHENQSRPFIVQMAPFYMYALGYGAVNGNSVEMADGSKVPVYHEVTGKNGAPLLWVLLSVSEERGDDILSGHVFSGSEDMEEDAEGNGIWIEEKNDALLTKLFFFGTEAPRWILLIGIRQIALLDRNKWNEKRYLSFSLDDIFSRHETSTFQAVTVLLHKESLCPENGNSVLDTLDADSHRHSVSVSGSLKYALRECIELLGNEVIYDMVHRRGIDLDKHPVDAGELTMECLRYMYRFLFLLFIEARAGLGFTPMESDVYKRGYSLEGLRDLCEMVSGEDSAEVREGYYMDETISGLFRLIYEGYPGDEISYQEALKRGPLHDVFTMEPLKAYIFDPQYTKLINEARLRNVTMLQIVDLMSISRPGSAGERRERISYSALGINQMGAVYEALLSYRGFLAEETLYEVKRAGDKFNELDAGYFIPERELGSYTEEEQVRYERGPEKGQLRQYGKGAFIYRLAGREREKSASYYTPEVLTRCLVKYALQELLKDRTADEILYLTVCEPAMGSAAFLNETINQLAEAYLNKKQKELGETIGYDERTEKLQEVKMYIAGRNIYGVDLNPMAVELAEVSLWLNTICKNASVPWFGMQLVCGNSLIGARRQTYSVSELKRGKWYEKAPARIMPGETRIKKGQKKSEQGIYHFLTGDPGMANYTDKVIRGLEPEAVKILNNRRKEFVKPYTAEETDMLLRLSELIDQLWERAAALRKQVRAATADSLCVYGQVGEAGANHSTIWEKDRIYKSIGGENAGPYAKLKTAMDYWCALWFWPVDQAELFPDRPLFMMEMDMILEGNLMSAGAETAGQMRLSTGDVNEEMAYAEESTGTSKENRSRYADSGNVNPKDLKNRNERIRIVGEIARQQKFMHWELEFADVFEERGGFDLMIGNPPWLKVTWNEQDILSEAQPLFVIRKYSAKEIMDIREKVLQNSRRKREYFHEYESISGMKNFLNAACNYEMLKGLQTNLYECFLPKAIENCNAKGIFAFVHPETVFNDSNGVRIREELYPRLRKHFRFSNAFRLFADVHPSREFGLNIYSNECTESFENIFNLYIPQTIDESYDDTYKNEVIYLKRNGERDLRGNRTRIIPIGREEAEVLAHVADGTKNWRSARLLVLHTRALMDILMVFYHHEKKVESLGPDIYSSMMWDETNAQKNGIIRRNTGFPHEPMGLILSGSHIGVANPFFHTPKETCNCNNDTDSIDLYIMDEEYMPRSNYEIVCERKEYYEKIPKTEWGEKYTDLYRIACRKMIDTEGARTLMAAAIPPEVGHTNGILGFAVKDRKDFAVLLGEFISLPIDFLVKVYGKGNFYPSMAWMIPWIGSDSKFAKAIILRVLLLNCVTRQYARLWESCYTEKFNDDRWAKQDIRLEQQMFENLERVWSKKIPVRNDYARRQLTVEIDVLVAQALGLTLKQLTEMYEIQFPILRNHEENTWYDKNGRIIFTNDRSLSGIGLIRKDFETIRYDKNGGYVKKYCENTTTLGITERMIRYEAPYETCDRLRDYEEVWHNFEQRFGREDTICD